MSITTNTRHGNKTGEARSIDNAGPGCLSPITNNEDITLIRTIDATKLVEDWKKSLNIDISEELRRHDKLYLYRCNRTGLKFFDPMELAGSSEFYEKLQELDWYYMYDKWEHQLAVKHLDGCQNILEIGSGPGHFIELATSHGLNVNGIELNHMAVEAAQKKGFHVERLDLEDAAELYTEQYDAVCSFQVLEHVSAPRSFIENSIRLLKPGGLLIYCVPNAESFLKYQYNLLNMPPHHMTLWSKRTFRSLEEYFPIKLESTSIEPLAKYHLAGYLEAYKRHLSDLSFLGKIIFNRYLLVLYKLLLWSGLRKFITGQSIYVCFRKTGG